VVIAEPYCIFQPSSASHVSNVLRIIDYFQVKFAVRSGGHNPSPGFSSIGQGGILVDLGKINQVVLSSDKSFASLGPGGRWGDVISILEAQGATVIGGRIPHVGVGGLVLGGMSMCCQLARSLINLPWDNRWLVPLFRRVWPCCR
jgi:FAD/FMN-containing dehydrogenase